MEVLLVEDETHDEFLDLLHEIALAAVALRAGSPGDPRPDDAAGGPAGTARDGDARRPQGTGLRASGLRLLRRWAVLAGLLLLVAAVTSTVLDARGSAAAHARLAADPGVLHPLDGPPSAQSLRGSSAVRTGAAAAQGTPRDGPAGTVELTLPGGVRASWTRGADGTFERGRLVDRRRSRGYALPGPLLLPRVTDGSVPRTLVALTADGGHLRGLALSTGSRLWSLPRTRTGQVEASAQVDGVLVLDEGTTVTAVDVRTGGVLWSAAVEPAVRGHALTDGHLVLLPVRDEDGALQLVARRLLDGAQAWRTPLPGGTTALSVVDHRLVVTAAPRVVDRAGS